MNKDIIIEYKERVWNCKKCKEFQGNAGMEDRALISCPVCEYVNDVRGLK